MEVLFMTYAYPLVADVASYQPDSLAYMQALRAYGVQAVIVKISEGSADGDAYVNPRARDQIANARKVGLKVHGYHYAKFNGQVDAEAEAKWFVANAVALGLTSDSVLALDYEDAKTAKRHGTGDCNAFFRKVKGCGFPKVDIYSMASWFRDGHLDMRSLIPKNYWIADYGVNAPSIASTGLWQFSSEVEIMGVATDMSYDLKGFYTGRTTEPASSAGCIWQPENGVFHLRTAIYLRSGAMVGAPVIAFLPVGASVRYDAYSIHDGYVWIRQPRADGSYGYIATGEAKNGQRTSWWGVFE